MIHHEVSRPRANPAPARVPDFHAHLRGVSRASCAAPDGAPSLHLRRCLPRKVRPPPARERCALASPSIDAHIRRARPSPRCLPRMVGQPAIPRPASDSHWPGQPDVDSRTLPPANRRTASLGTRRSSSSSAPAPDMSGRRGRRGRRGYLLPAPAALRSAPHAGADAGSRAGVQ
jgi:hypothetical protein